MVALLVFKTDGRRLATPAVAAFQLPITFIIRYYTHYSKIASMILCADPHIIYYNGNIRFISGVCGQKLLSIAIDNMNHNIDNIDNITLYG